MAAQPKFLQQSILDGGIRSVNFFNGRLLTGEDLSREQQARRDADRRLGIAMGDGVAWGLEVTLAADQSKGPVVTIAAGLAFNRKGQSLYLETPVDVVLSDRAAPQTENVASFKDCRLLGGAYAAKPGIYLLTIAPASADEGKAPTHALDGGGRCTTDAFVEAVQFRLLALSPELDAAARSDPDRMRNSVAGQCFGLDRMAKVSIDPFGIPVQVPEPLEALAGKAYTRCDVALAVVRVTTKIEFIDLWAVRRRPTPCDCYGVLAFSLAERRRAEGEAMFLQFQAHLADMLDRLPVPANLQAHDYFGWLPPAGVLPIAGPNPNGVSATTFFRNMTVRFPRPPIFGPEDGPVFMDGARLPALLRDATLYPPLDTSAGEALWLYRVRENRLARDRAAASAGAAVVVFANGQLPYFGSPRLDVSRFNYANYSSAQAGPGGI